MEHRDCSRPRIRRFDGINSVASTYTSDADVTGPCTRVLDGVGETHCFIGPSDESIVELEVLPWYPVLSADEELLDFGQVVSWNGRCVAFELR